MQMLFLCSAVGNRDTYLSLQKSNTVEAGCLETQGQNSGQLWEGISAECKSGARRDRLEDWALFPDRLFLDLFVFFKSWTHFALIKLQIKWKEERKITSQVPAGQPD